MNVGRNVDKTTKVRHTHLLSSGNGVVFEMKATLARAADTPKGQDEWLCEIASEYGGRMDITYRMGTGHRRSWDGKRLHYPTSVYDWERSRPVAPEIRDVLHSIAGDYQTARDMPRDEADAMDHLTAEFGSPEGSASAQLRLVRMLNKEADDLRGLLRGTGIDADHFADYWSDEDNKGEDAA